VAGGLRGPGGRELTLGVKALLAAARRRHPEITLLEASHLDYDLRLADVITDRLGELPATDRPVLESTG